MPLGLLAVLLAASPPSDVFLKTPEQSFSYENLYALKDGKLWVKPNPRSGAAPGEWALFDGTGVPFGKKATSFGSGERLASFGTEGLMVVAAAESGRLYVWQPTLFDQPTPWMDRVGQPLAGPLTLPPHRDWAFSMSVQVAPKKRLTPMHDIDAYYEDAAGNRIEFGFTATVYVLDPNGQRIRYWDTGLPPAFYKAFATPERGRFVAERLSASGSTLFVIDASGKMFTRMMDYEMFGACPGLRYTFERKPGPPSKDILPLMEADRVLPLEGWREQPAIPLSGQAQLTTGISIHMTGQGNAARELRVQGRDATGRSGYWWKPLVDAAWRFQETGEAYDAKSAIAPRAAHAPGPPLDKTYSGTLKQSGAPELAVDLVDFDYYDTPATLRLHQGGRTWDVALHTFDAWGPMVQQKEHPALVGSVLGEPKLLVGTLEVPEEMLRSQDPQTHALVETYLARFHHVHQAFAISADDGRVDLRTRLIQRKGTGPFAYAVRRPIEISVHRELSADELSRYEETDFVHLCQSSELVLSEPASLSAQDAPKVREALRRNQALLAEIQKRSLTAKAEHLEAGAVSALASAAFVPVNLVSDAIGLPSKVPLAGGIALTGGHVLEQYAAMNLARVITSPEDSRQAEALLKERIRTYEALERKLGAR